jgi:phosphotriesterase-related protein
MLPDPRSVKKEGSMAHVMTTLGPIDECTACTFLPHEHVFVDLRTPGTRGHAEARTDEVVKIMAPMLEQARRQGIGVIAEASTVGVGRRADILRAVSEASQLPLVVPTGVYREPWVPSWVHAADEDALFEWMRGELEDEIEKSGIRAGWIKLSAGDNGLTPTETKVLRAAARAARETGAVIGSHTLMGGVVMEELRIIESLGLSPDRFIWIHAHIEEDFETNLAAARRGAWIEYDAIGAPDSERFFIERIRRMLDSGMGDQLLLSQDRGHFDPAKPQGGEQKPYTYLLEKFLPALAASGLDGDTICGLTQRNPFLAFAR